ncbi:MAG TPA: LLM class flavin-dependent oxidoreductase [Methylomirabilota bacterium]|nr:LLM class flavin-dependent oxidoreductase [Methylomirabilota bacterium]
MSKIIFGVALYGTEHAREGVELARIAEDLGFQRFWIGDSHMIWRELYVLAGAIGMATKKIEIGPGVTHPAVRHLTVTASAMATLNEITNGRAFLGFGVGATGPGNIGMNPHTVPQLEEDIVLLKKLLAGETVTTGGTKVRCLFPSPGVPIYIGTRAPQGMKIACRLTDGFVYTGETGSLKTVVENIRGYTTEAKRPADDVQFIYRMPCSISDDSATAREDLKGKIARSAFTHLGRLYNRGELHDDTDRKAVEHLRSHYDSYHHMGPEHNHLVRDEWVDRFGLGGTADHVCEKVREFIAAGIDELTIVPCGEPKKATLESFARDVMEKL